MDEKVLETIVAWTFWSLIPICATALINEYYSVTDKCAERQIERRYPSGPEIWVL